MILEAGVPLITRVIVVEGGQHEKVNSSSTSPLVMSYWSAANTPLIVHQPGLL